MSVSSTPSRVDQIREAIQTMQASLDAWRLSDSELFPESLENAISAGLNVLLNGDIPEAYVSLFRRAIAVGEVWAAVLAGRDGLIDQNTGNPTIGFWKPFEELLEHFDVVASSVDRKLESVASLMESMKDYPHRYEQIARMYGCYDSATDKWQGPFYLRNGTVNIAAIEQEARSPGSIVPPGFDPLASRKSAIRQESISALARVRHKLAESSPQADRDRDPATVEQLLREGQFPDVIASVKGCEESFVRSEAARLGIEIIERDESMNAAFARMQQEETDLKNPEFASAPESAPVLEREDPAPELDETLLDDSELSDPSDSTIPETQLLGDDLKAFVELAFSENADITSADIIRMVQADGMTTSGPAVGRALAGCRRAAEEN